MTLATREQVERAEARELEQIVNRAHRERREREALEEAQAIAATALLALRAEQEKRVAAERLFKKGTCGIACAGLAILLGLAGAWPLAIAAAVGCGAAIVG